MPDPPIAAVTASGLTRPLSPPPPARRSSCTPEQREGNSRCSKDNPSRLAKMQPEPVQAVHAAITEIDKAHAAAVTAVNAAPDAKTAFAALNELVAHIQGLVDSHTELRNQVVGRVWEAEKLSLAALADRVGMSKRRAEQQGEVAEDGGDSTP